MNVNDITMNGTNEKYRFDPFDWLRQFKIASESRSGFRELRADIFQNTVNIVCANGYRIGDESVIFNNDATRQDSTLYDTVPVLPPSEAVATQFSVIEADCLETAELLKKAGFNPCVLNMANRQNPGGGVLDGAGAQEENIFRRSNIFMSLFQYAIYADEYGIPRASASYPLNRNTGGCYSGRVTVFRGSERAGYCILKRPFEIAVVTVPAINRPDLKMKNEQYYIADDFLEPTKEKIRTIFRIAGERRHDSLVLGAFGCGAFRNPPHHMAALFKEVFAEDEFRTRFRLVVFAIIDDHNSHMSHNPQGNFYPFLNEFDAFCV